MGLALRWVRAGETVIIGSREENRAVQAAATIQGTRGRNSAYQRHGKQRRLCSRRHSDADGSVCRPGFASSSDSSRRSLPGSILIDATVPLAAEVGGRASRTLGVWQGSAAEQAAELVPKDVSVVAAFHNVSADLMGGDNPLDCDVIVCSDDSDAAQLTCELAAKIPGIRAIDGGKLENARIVEQITALLIGLNMRHKGHAGIRITGLPPAAYR